MKISNKNTLGTDDIPYINVPLHTLLVVRSHGYNYEVETVPLKVECVDTYRYQPKVIYLHFFCFIKFFFSNFF